MATDRVIMEKQCCHFFSAVFYPILFILAGYDDMHESLEEFEIRQDQTDFECLKKSPLTYNGKNGVATFSWLFLIGSISYLQVTVIYMRGWMSLKFGQI